MLNENVFIGRKKELNELTKAYKSNNFESILIYGVRYVGKSRLVKESLNCINDNVVIIYFNVLIGTLATNIKILTNIIRRSFNNKYLTFYSLEQILEFIFEQSIRKKIFFVIDEFSFLLDLDIDIKSKLVTFIDKYINDSKLKLVLITSDTKIKKEVISSSSTLYNKCNHIIYLEPFDYYDSSLFYKNYSDEDKIITYLAFGGLALINNQIDPSLTPLQNIKNLIIARNTLLEFLIERITLKTKTLPYINYAISLIAQGITKRSDLISVLKKSGNDRNSYLLDKLEEMDIIEKFTPINNKSNKKKTYYSIKDNCLHFYYRYIYGTIWSYLRFEPDKFFQKLIKEDFYNAYLHNKLNEITKSFLNRKNLKNEINPPILESGTYLYEDKKNKANQLLNCVTKDQNGYVSYKYIVINDKVGIKEINEEETKLKDIKQDFYKLGFVSTKGFNEDIDRNKYNLFPLKDFYKD